MSRHSRQEECIEERRNATSDYRTKDQLVLAIRKSLLLSVL